MSTNSICITYPVGYNIDVQVKKGLADIVINQEVVHIRIHRGCFTCKRDNLELEVRLTRSIRYTLSEWLDTRGIEEHGPDIIFVYLKKGIVDVKFQVNHNQFEIETQYYADNICFLGLGETRPKMSMEL